MLAMLILALSLTPIAALQAPGAAPNAAPQAAPQAAAATAPAAQSTPAAPLPRRAGPLGVRIDPDIADRAVVREIVAGSPAATAGIRAGDTIVSVAGKPVGEFDSLRAAMRGLLGGQSVAVEILRDGTKSTVELVLTELREEVEGSTVTYSSVAHPDGYRLRTIIT